MTRACFTLQVREDRMAEYVASHKAVWPEMLAALRRTGWTNYSLFLRSDGLLIAYFESHDPLASVEAMAEVPVNELWRKEMEPILEASSLAGGPHFELLPEVFHLD